MARDRSGFLLAARRGIERDLHYGAQQRLVPRAIQLRAAQTTVPPELEEVAAAPVRWGHRALGRPVRTRCS